MYFSYFDESGDDGFPNYSSPIFVLTAVYLPEKKWKETYANWVNFRMEMKSGYQIPQKMEMHTRDFLLNKSPYNNFNYSDEKRIEIIEKYLNRISKLEIKVINVAIAKTKILAKNYPILENSMNYSIQRIENDLQKNHSNQNFIMISDEGRVGKMVRIARKIQRFNYIPSKYDGQPYRKEISLLLEDPLPKNSAQSYFIQIADMIASIIYWYVTSSILKDNLPTRLSRMVNGSTILSWMEIVKPVLNLQASANSYGIVIYPK
jgi:hypothetical protein